MRIVVVGLGHVGLPIAIVLSQHYSVTVVDNNMEIINQVKNRNNKYFEHPQIDLKKLKLDVQKASIRVYRNADIILIAVPTDLDKDGCALNTDILDSVLKMISDSKTNATIIIKSTVPIGYTEKTKKIYNLEFLFFSPEFLREEHEVQDLLYPSRNILGCYSKKNTNIHEINRRAQQYAGVINECILDKNKPFEFLGIGESEAIKLFSNTYLALRISFFNELDMYCEQKGLNTFDIINGVCEDERIGNTYNNPSFGFGGYCLPKDTKQLMFEFKNTNNSIINAISMSNELRKKYIANKVLNLKIKNIGVYRLTSKKGATNLRSSATTDILSMLITERDIKVFVFEPYLKEGQYDGFVVVNNLQKFKEISDLVVANRIDSDLEDIKFKIYSRDIMGND